MRHRERRERRKRDAYICLDFYLSVEGGQWEGLSIIPNHLYSAVHITLPRSGAGESRLICIGKSNCSKAVGSTKCVSMLMYTFGVFVQCEKLGMNTCVCGDRCKPTTIHKKKVFLTTPVAFVALGCHTPAL